MVVVGPGPTSHNGGVMVDGKHVCMIKSLEHWSTFFNEGRGTAGGRRDSEGGLGVLDGLVLGYTEICS